jgi:hypothetical protein
MLAARPSSWGRKNLASNEGDVDCKKVVGQSLKFSMVDDSFLGRWKNPIHMGISSSIAAE